MGGRGVGRLSCDWSTRCARSGRNSLPELRQGCRTLYEGGKDELLRDLSAGRLTLREVWAIYRTVDWRRLPSAQHARRFARSYGAWCATRPAAYARFAGWAQNAIAPVPETLAELRAALLRYLAGCEAANRGATFNRVLAAVRAFLRDTVTTDHVLYHDVSSGRMVRRWSRRLREREAAR